MTTASPTSSPAARLAWQAVQPPRPITLQGRYVTLEPLEADRHAPALWEAARGHDSIWTWLGDGPYAAAEDLHRALAEKQRSASAVFLAILPEPGLSLATAPQVASSQAQPGESAARNQSASGDDFAARDDLASRDQFALGRTAAGYASLMRAEPAHGVVEVGNILMTPALQRTRAATEAMYLMARHVFEDLGYRRYEWKCNTNNEPSRRAALRLGFSFEGTVPPAHGRQRPEPRHRLVFNARPRVAPAQNRIREVARPRQLRRTWKTKRKAGIRQALELYMCQRRRWTGVDMPATRGKRNDC